MSTTEDVAAALRFDPLAAAESITGHSYKEDEATGALGFLQHINHTARKDALLRAAGDTSMRSTWSEFMAVVADLGFEVVLKETFRSVPYGDEPAVTETYIVAWHQDGLLLDAETYMGDKVNSAKVRYNIQSNGDWLPSEVTSSGGYASTDPPIWSGDHDAREGLRSKLAGLRGAGTFLPQWVDQPFLWLLTYADSKVDGYDYKALTESRVAGLPEHVRAAISPTAEVK